MRNVLLLLFSALSLTLLSAQTTTGLVAYYPFESSFDDVTGNSGNVGMPEGNPGFNCGVVGQSLQLNGTTDQLAFLGPVTDEFDTEDFSVSMYFKSTGDDGLQYLISKRRSDCASDFSFFIRYRPATRNINCVLAETPNKAVSLTYELDADRCWQHLAVVREGNRVRLYVNGALVQEGGTVGRIDLSNDGALILGGSDCLSTAERRFQGVIDEFRVYNRALGNEDVRSLYFSPDMIANPDTLIFLGNSVDVRLLSNCGTAFSWSPVDGVSDPAAAEPTITPSRKGPVFYSVSISDDISNCVAIDSFRINVVDPDDLDCNRIFLPTAFTPNGDGLNDTFGVSNPFALGDLISFEIFDRWGSRMFFTDDPFTQWDGSFGGTPVNSGVMLYKLVYRCDGEEKVKTGSLTVLR